MENNQIKEKLLAEIERLKKELKESKKKKKYGLVWEDKLEDVVEMCKEKLPVLKEVKNKEIITDKNKPVNLLIEGDNYHALSVLNYTHKGKIDIIYIDPPYNTGNKDFKYNDSFVDKEDSFRHSKWLSFMDKRLRLARHLLANTGVFFISIDDNEQASLRLLCNEIFGEDNFIDAIIWKKTENIKMDSKFLSQNKDYILCYRKSSAIQSFLKEQSDIERFKLEDKKGKYYLRKLDSLSSSYSRGMDYVIEHEGLKYYAGGSKKRWKERQKINPGKKAPTWLWSKKTYEDGLKNDEVVFKNGNIYNKVRYDGLAKKPFVNIQNLVSQQTAQKELEEMFGKRVFDHPKPPQLIKWLILLILNNGSATILDFFAGSGTTGHAVIELNKADNGSRKFIICTNNEGKIAEEVCYPRIEKVINGYKTPKNEKINGLGGNLKYFKTDFVDYKESTDKNKIKLTKEVVEMLCIKEGTFESVLDNKDFKIFKNHDHYAGIIFDQLAIENFKKAIKDIKGKISVYIFSLGDDSFEDEFEDIKQKVKLSPIPEAILKVYKKIYK